MDVTSQLSGISKLAASMKDGVEESRGELIIALRSLLDEVEPPAERLWRTLVRSSLQIHVRDHAADWWEISVGRGRRKW